MAALIPNELAVATVLAVELLHVSRHWSAAGLLSLPTFEQVVDEFAGFFFFPIVCSEISWTSDANYSARTASAPTTNGEGAMMFSMVGSCRKSERFFTGNFCVTT